jgi:hypothetical protein
VLLKRERERRKEERMGGRKEEKESASKIPMESGNERNV